jgi:GxxExxY protein
MNVLSYYKRREETTDYTDYTEKKRKMKLIYEEESYRIRGCMLTVFNELGNGFLEEVYQEALSREFALAGIPYTEQEKLLIYYHGQPLTHYYIADFVCFDKIIVELKAVRAIAPEHRAQTINYLKAAKLKLGLLVNFGTPAIQIERLLNNPETKSIHSHHIHEVKQ